MYIEKLSFLQFKNFSKTDLVLKPGFHFITGPNGSGKTNFLDAIYYLSMTRSFLKIPDKSLVQHGAEFFRLELNYVKNDKRHELNIKCRPPGTKEMELDHKKLEKFTDYIGQLPVVIIAPDEVFTLMNEQEERRKFLNQTLIQSDADYFNHLYAYNKLLKQRNAALKQMRHESRLNHQLLDAIDYVLIPHAIAIYKKRKELVDNINPSISGYVCKISNDQQGGHLIYESEVNDNYEHVLNQSREKDYYSNRTNIGVHRDQINCMMDSHLLNEIGSQGQMKSFVVAMKLAQFNYLRALSGSTPLVLLDDIFAKLDAIRVNKLLEILQNEHIDQCFITDTHEDRIAVLIGNIKESSYLYRIKQNCIQSQ